MLSGLLIGALGGCARQPTASYTPLAGTTPADVAARLLFLSGRLTTAPDGTRLEILSLKAVPGELKTPDAEAEAPDFVRVSQLDARGQALAAQRVPHPLRRRVEHVADDHRTFQRSEVLLPTAEFFVRLALKPTATTIRLEEIADGKTTLLTELPIPAKS